MKQVVRGANAKDSARQSLYICMLVGAGQAQGSPRLKTLWFRKGPKPQLWDRQYD